MAPERVLVTGGAGFIGSRLVSRMCQEGIEVLVVDVLHPQVHQKGRPSSLPEAVELVPLDVTHGPAWDALFQLFKPDAVVHLAAETGTGQSLLEATRHGSVNVVGTTQLLDAMARSGHIPAHLVLASSRAVYGEGEWEADGDRFYPAPRTHAELEAGRWDPRSPTGGAVRSIPSVAGSTRTEPINIYGATKLAQEHIMKAWGAALGSSVSILRLQNVYGVGQSLTNPYTGVLSLFAQMALSGQTLPVYEDGAIVRDFVYVDDVVAALWGALRIPPPLAAYSTSVRERPRRFSISQPPWPPAPKPRSPRSPARSATETSGPLHATSRRRAATSATSPAVTSVPVSTPCWSGSAPN